MSRISDLNKKFEADESSAPFLWNFNKDGKMYSAVYHLEDKQLIATFNSATPNSSTIQVIYLTADLGQKQDDAKLKANQDAIINEVLSQASDNTKTEGNFTFDGIAVSWAYNAW
ncbi:structural protein [Yersinia phage YerA41]|uniref:Structural protein n=1 Tax=Yersinia phage vB_Yru_GN1 TaxID=3074381 RepID=A0AA86MA51_9CAUD|nr:structural protein [Yersinia phage YerA41]BES79796.1 structural protein [Yersinia phage vB_Yru_GN1]